MSGKAVSDSANKEQPTCEMCFTGEIRLIVEGPYAAADGRSGHVSGWVGNDEGLEAIRKSKRENILQQGQGKR